MHRTELMIAEFTVRYTLLSIASWDGLGGVYVCECVCVWGGGGV